jgi:hypothetical protein
MRKRKPNIREKLDAVGIYVVTEVTESQVMVDGKLWATVRVVGEECHVILPPVGEYGEHLHTVYRDTNHTAHAVEWAQYYAGPRLERKRLDAYDQERCRRDYYRTLYKDYEDDEE